jgi:hypothetical protein
MNRANTPEVELLLLCTKPARSKNDLSAIRLLLSRLNWDLFYKTARRHSVLPLAYRRLNETAGAIVPADELQKLKLAYEQNAARNLILTNELVQITQALDKNGIQSIAYKGPALAVRAYGDTALRRFVDLDVMVRRENVQQAAEVLAARGYHPAKNLTKDQQALLLQTQHNLQFVSSGRIIVELHWQVSSQLFASSVTAEELWNNLETVSLNGFPVKSFSTEDLLFSLCVHGSRHLWERLAWIADVAHLLQVGAQIDWPALIARARTANAERMFLLGLLLASDLLDIQLPELVSKRIAQDKVISELANAITARLFDGPEHHQATTRQIFTYNLQVRRGLRSRLQYLLFTLAPTESDVSWFRVPARWRLAYYFLRPFRIFAKRPEALPLPPMKNSEPRSAR